MKKKLTKIAAFAFCFGLFSAAAIAQKEESKIKVRIEKNVDGEVQIIEKEVDATGLSENERQALIESIQDSLIGDLKSQNKTKIVIEDEDIIRLDDDFDFEAETEHHDLDFSGERRHRYDDVENVPEVRVYKHKKGAGSDWDELEFELERIGENIERFGLELPSHIERHLPRFYAWTDDVLGQVTNGKAIRSLEVYPNRPDSEIINVSFFAPEEGDITIVVLDTKGNSLAKKTAAAFKGEYVGQIALEKATKGSYFVIVSQGNDGQSRKVVID